MPWSGCSSANVCDLTEEFLANSRTMSTNSEATPDGGSNPHGEFIR